MKQLASVAICFVVLTLASCTQNGPQSGAANVTAKTNTVSDSALAPRAADGRPDFSGIWQAEGFGGDDSTLKYFLNIAADLKPGEIPIQPWAAALYEKRVAAFGKDEPDTRCLPSGVPKIDAASEFKLVQVPGLTVILYERFGLYRQVFTDGRDHPNDYQPSWMGHSIGKWNGDVFVVDSVGFNDRTWLDARGHPHTDALHVVERFRRIDFGHMEIQITVEDSKAYTKSLTYTLNPRLLRDTELMEFVCNENEKDLEHLIGK